MADLEVLADAACLVVLPSEPTAPGIRPITAPGQPNVMASGAGDVLFSAVKAPPLMVGDPSADERSPSAPTSHGPLKLKGVATTSPSHPPAIVSHVASAPLGPFTATLRMMQATSEMVQPTLSITTPQQQLHPPPLPMTHTESDTPTLLAHPSNSDEDKDEGTEEPAAGDKLDRPCSACRLSRVRCNRMFPCSRCTRLGLECKQPRKVQRGRPSHKAQQAQVDAQHTMAQVHALATQAPGPFSMGVVSAAGARQVLPWPATVARDGLASHGDFPPAAMTTHDRLTQLLEMEMQHGHLLQVVGALRAQLRRLGSMPCA